MEEGKEPKRTPEQEFLSPEAQYREVNQHLLMQIGFIWRLPPISMAVSGAVIVSAFGIPIPDWRVRGAITILGLLWALAQWFWIWKFRKYCDHYMGTLLAIENEHALRLVQGRMPPGNTDATSDKYWHYTSERGSLPNWLPKRLSKWLTADYVFMEVSVLSAALFVALFIYNLFSLRSWP